MDGKSAKERRDEGIRRRVEQQDREREAQEDDWTRIARGLPPADDIKGAEPIAAKAVAGHRPSCFKIFTTNVFSGMLFGTLIGLTFGIVRRYPRSAIISSCGVSAAMFGFLIGISGTLREC
eukprot:TRINITY_DN5863_c0_g1_i1.p1 TRINITY_DN5863_c0_g1~~TRINITY_DN5863_c0_g1_i1.p1  ORF type:complete len:135 (+),score=29.71 TRINITY_DN5863_c0_g1_i1:43-405(+)